MPVILPRQAEDVWLDPTTELAKVRDLLKPYPASELDFYPVSRAVNSPQHNTPDCIVPSAEM
jgi:putative SOS response-associated peptidase YedK